MGSSAAASGFGTSSTRSEQGTQTRRDIQGLRAVAVLSVVLYHAGVPVLPGGYVGVDVFFVISGFLITGLLLRERQRTGRIALLAFYGRRIRRLLPAALLVLVTTLVLARLLLAPLTYTRLAKEGLASALYVPNLLFARDGTDYLAEESTSPFLHFWSLAVEEQFYLFWPFLILLLAWRGGGVRRIALGMGVVSLASLALCVVLTNTEQPYAYFTLPPRAWELAAGALIALFLPQLERLSRATGNALSWVGLVLIAVSVTAYDDQTAFPGYTALLPVLGSAMVIAGGAMPGRGGAERLLGLGPAVWVGGLSYSLYLWHWPLLVIPENRLGELPSPLERGGLVLLAVALSFATLKLLEDPVRHARRLRRPAPALGLGAGLTATAVAASVAMSIVPQLHSGQRVPRLDDVALTGSQAQTAVVPVNLRPSLRASFDDLPRTYGDGCHLDFLDTRSPECTYGEADADVSIALIGDSHAAQWFPALRQLTEGRSWQVRNLTKSACRFARFTPFNDQLRRPYTECPEWRENVQRELAADPPELIIVTNSALLDETDEGWGEALERELSDLPSQSAVMVLSDTPRFPQSPNLCLSANPGHAERCHRTKQSSINAERFALDRAAADAAGATFVDVTSWICPDDVCSPVRGDVLLYRDSHHLTTTFNRALSSLLEEEILTVLEPRSRQ